MKIFALKHRVSLVLFSLFLLIFSFLTLPSYVSAYQEILIENRGWHAIRVIKVILDGEHFVVASVADEWGETIQSLTKKVWWTSSINWAFSVLKIILAVIVLLAIMREFLSETEQVIANSGQTQV